MSDRVTQHTMDEVVVIIGAVLRGEATCVESSKTCHDDWLGMRWSLRRRGQIGRQGEAAIHVAEW